jgi:predicted DNA-binding protein with PD1-like motif
MKSKLIHAGELKKWAVVFSAGDEVVEGLKKFARQNQLAASQLTAIGAFSDCVLGYFNFEKRDYKRIPVAEQVEVLSLIGDVTLDENGHPKIHAHVVLGKSDGTAHGGHLLQAHVKPTLEVIVTESPEHLRRRPDAVSGLALIDIEADG